MNSPSTRSGGLFRNNPVAVMLVGLCPAAAVTGRVIDALWMSAGLILVLILTRLSLEILKALAFPRPGTRQMTDWLSLLFLASCFTAAFELVLGAFAPDESAGLGIYAPLIAVNCIVLDRLGERGSQEPAGPGGIGRSLGQAGGLGAGFALSLIVISLIRETLGSGTITLFPMGSFGGTIAVGGISLAPARALVYAGGGLLCLGYLAGAARLLRRVNGGRSGGVEAERA